MKDKMRNTLNERKPRISHACVIAVFVCFACFALSPQPKKIWRPTRVPAGTEFLGREACAECHKSIVETQSKSSMGIALELVSESAILKAHERLNFKEGKYSYEIVRKGDQSFYQVTDGRETIREPILYSFGQGKAGQTYVLKHDGEFYEGRVSFYTDIDNLDLTIGHSLEQPPSLLEALGSKLPKDQTSQCFNCHSTGSVSGGRIHLDKLTPGVSCEACHGPGQAHVAAGRAGQPNKAMIFNPGRLGGDDLNQEFCGACHRSVDDVIVEPGQRGLNNVRFQPYRIFNSKCYSDDRRISCIGCHNPHESLKHDTAYYDEKCAACHQRSSEPSAVSKTMSARVCKVATKDCVSCHMPKVVLPGAHFKFTDHRIRIVKPGEAYPY